MATGDQLLFLELAKALSKPSKAYRATEAALGIPQQALEGYLGGNDIASKIKQAQLQRQPLEEALGGVVPERVRGYAKLPVSTIKELGGLGDIAKLTDEGNNGDFLTPMQAKEYGLPESFISSFGGKPINRNVAQGYASNQQRGRIAGALETRNNLNVANAINRNVNSLTSGTGALALAGKNNLRISRVKSLLERPTALTPQELELVTTDLAGVVQGGVPLKDTVEGQAIGTVATKFADILKQATNNPQTFNDAGFRQRIVQLANEMISADNEVQGKAFKMVEANFGHLTTPEHLQRIKDAIASGTQLPIADVSGSDLSNISEDALRAIAASGD